MEDVVQLVCQSLGYVRVEQGSVVPDDELPGITPLLSPEVVFSSSGKRYFVSLLG